MHPPLYPLLSADNWREYGTKHLRWNSEEQYNAQALLDKGLLPVVRGPEIAYFLGIPPKTITRMAYAPNRYYRQFSIPKRSGAYRQICAPRVYLKVIQRYLNDCILSQVPLPDYVVGFVKGRSARSGASLHVAKRFLWNIDLKDFFGTVSSAMSVFAFERLGYTGAAARFMSRLCCLHGALPQGAPSSPTLANLAFLQIDSEISGCAVNHGITYTRYADDLSFSSNNPIGSDFRSEIVGMVTSGGFQINELKTRLVGPGARREITGLVINTRISVPRERRRLVRSLVHNLKTRRINDPKAIQRAIGYISYIKTHHPSEAQRYIKELGDLIPSKD